MIGIILTPTRVTPRMDNEELLFFWRVVRKKMIATMLTPTRVTPRMDNEEFLFWRVVRKKNDCHNADADKGYP